METKNEIIGAMAKARTVERLVENVARRHLDPTLRDLCQMVYAILLDYPEDKIQDLHRCGQLTFFAARIVINQYRSRNSTFWYQVRQFSARSLPMLEPGDGTDPDV